MLQLLNHHISFKPYKRLFDRKPIVTAAFVQEDQVLIFPICNN